LAPLAVLGAVYLVPYAAAVGAAWSAPLAAAPAALGRIVGFTLAQAAWSTLAALALGLPAAWLFASPRSAFGRFWKAVLSVPFALPPIIVVLGFVLMWGNAGWANRLREAAGGDPNAPWRFLYKPEAIVFAHAFYNFPVVMRLVGASLAQIRSRYAPAAAALGAAPAQASLMVAAPLAAPAALSAALLVFLYCLTSFAVVLVLGGGPGATTLPVEIYRAARISLDAAAAGRLALIETAVAAVAYAAYARAEKTARRWSGEADAAASLREAPPPRRPSESVAGGIYAVVLAPLIVGPVAALVAQSFLDRTSRAAAAELGLRWWRELGGGAVAALGRSLVLAAGAASLATAIAASAALYLWLGGRRRDFLGRCLRFLCLSPLLSSGIVLGLGWNLAYRGAVGGPAALAALHAVLALPFAFRSIDDGLASLPPSIASAAAALGSPPFRTAWRVVLFAAAPRLRSAWAFAAALSLGELNAVLMLGLGDWETLPLLVYRATAAYRFGAAAAAGSLLALLCAAAYFWADGQGRKELKK
jgi:thiamine transport system permease protein